MEDLEELCKWIKTEKGITEISMEELLSFIPEFEEWKQKNKEV